MRLDSDKNIQAFFELLRAGLWEKEARLSQYKDVDFSVIIQLAEEQSVVGLITAGLEHIVDVKVPQEWLLQFIGSTIQIEQQNKAMNQFVAWLIDYLRKKDVYTLLVKGQGVAQCYEKPLWRSCGDIDLFLSDTNYERAKGILLPLATAVEREYHLLKHIGLTIEGFSIELHGTLRSRLTKRIDNGIDIVQKECFYNGEVRSWLNGKTQVFLPAANQDIIFVFTHILHHFFVEGIGLKQICDWCRLLWTFQNKIDYKKLENHLREIGLLSEWKVFASLAVNWLGMPEDAMPLYTSDRKWKRKAAMIMSFVVEYGASLQQTRQQVNESTVKTFFNRTLKTFKITRVFPIDAWKIYLGLIRTAIIFRNE